MIHPPRLKAGTAANYCSAWSTGWRSAAAVAAAAVAAAAVVGGTTRGKWTKWCPPGLGQAEFSKTAHHGHDLNTDKKKIGKSEKNISSSRIVFIILIIHYKILKAQDYISKCNIFH